MRCSKCNSDNREGRKFCANCGAPLAVTCLKCGASNQPVEKFCGECGAALVEAAAPATEVKPIAMSGGGERRHLTVLFCDLVGSTAIAAQLDPEEWRELVAGYHRAAAEAVTRYGGHVAKYLGDGVMAYFGWPEAHDNDGERAARAGLAILEAIAKLNEQPGRPTLSARVGIHSGAVVVGLGAGKEADVFGDAPNIAARVQEAAAPGTVLVTEDTHRLVAGLFAVEARRAPPLKGIERPIELYRVVQLSGVRGRLEAAAAARGLTSFVGREDELRLLMNRWERVLDGEGQVVTVIGEAGIGKSRLLRQFHEAIAERPHTWLEAGAGAFFQNTPFYPVSETLRLFASGDEDTIAQLARRLEAAGLLATEAIPLLTPLLNLPLPREYTPSTLPPDQQRRRLLATLVQWQLGSARTPPLVSVIEDLHWADPSTLELIQLLVEQGATAPLLLLYTARPEFHPPWPLRAHHAQLNLNRLSTREVRTMVREVAARAALPDETVATVVERTAGVPLFVEELTRAVLETGSGKLSGNTIPVTLHDSLMARLDRLGPAKEVAQVGAVIGREFSYELLYAVHPIVEAELQQRLSDLADAELLYVHGIAPDATYQFKHALIRDAAYEALLKSRRKELHRRVARTINERFATFKESHPEVLARHWAEADEIEPAISAWQKAGERAVAQRAFREAEQHYRDALTMLLALPESNERASRELTMQLALGGIMVATQGWSAIDTDTVYARAKTLAAQEGTAESVNVFYGLWATAVSRGELRAALVLADQTLEIARGVKRPHALVSAHFGQGATRMALGDLVAARQHLILAIEYYREEDFRGIADDHGVNARVWAGLNEWLLGYADSAERYTDDASALARRLNKPFALAYAEENGALTDGLRGDFNRASSASREAEKLGMELGFPILSAQGKILGSWARAHIGELSDAVDLIRAGLWELDAIKYYWNRGVFLTLLGEAQALVGAIDDAILTVEHVPQTYPDELLSHPLTLRLRGEMRLRSDAGVATRFDLAERDFREAIELARKMSAKSLELRATMSLAWLFLKQGKRGEGRAMLAAIYNWFTEGFDTADLKEAKALLDELSS